MNAQELRNKSVAELRSDLLELRKAQFSWRMSRGMGGETKPHLNQQLRRDIARVKTVLREKSAAGGGQ